MNSSSRKKILFIATRQFWPTAGGKDITLYYNCKGLYERCSSDIYLVCFTDKNTNKSAKIPDFIKEVKYIETPVVKAAIGRIIKYSFGPARWPLQNSLYYMKTSEKLIFEYYKEVAPDIVIIDMVRLVPYAEMLRFESVKKILIEDDLLAKRYRRQIEASVSGNFIGQFSKNISSGLNSVINSKFIKNTVLKTEIKRLEKYESKCVELFDFITFVSPIETEEFNHTYNTNKAITLTMGADISYYGENFELEKEPNTLSIVANCTTAANADSLEMICTRILPKLRNHYEYKIIGKYTPQLREKIESNQVQFLGFVDDIRKTVESTVIYLSPMAYGTGIKTKIVEAMAMGMPVVTNSIGAEGLNVVNGQELFIVDDETKLAETVDRLFDDPELCKKIGQVAQEFVKQNHSWDRVYEAFEEMDLV